MNKHTPAFFKVQFLVPFLLLLLAPAWNAFAEIVFLDKIAIIVDDDVIMASEIQQRMAAIQAKLATTPDVRLPPEDVLREQVVERLIVESLQLQIAERSGVRISDTELNQALASVAAQNGMTLDDFRAAVADDGLAWTDMRDQVRREMSIGRVQQGIMNRRIVITDQEIDNFLASDLGESITSDDYQLGHILLTLPGDNPGPSEIRATKSKAEELLQRLNDGEDFSSLAVEFSAGQNALNGGDMGWRKPAQMPTVFAGLLEDMKVGQIKGPIRSGRGFHLIKLLDRRGAVAQGQIAQTQVRHILVTPNEIRSQQEATELAESLRLEIVEGRDFAEVARLHSDDPGSALSGGDLGWNQAGVFVPAFDEVMQASPEGEISRVFQTEHGMHFLEVTGRRTEDFSDEFKRNQAENYLRNQKFDEEVENWLRDIRGKAFVDIRI
ncbi:MAG: peptidylprolyl isomerase [Pseudomonadales bacterium]